eukprot:1194946-Prorocentrum_minimum.AAC.6
MLSNTSCCTVTGCYVTTLGEKISAVSSLTVPTVDGPSPECASSAGLPPPPPPADDPADVIGRVALAGAVEGGVGILRADLMGLGAVA